MTRSGASALCTIALILALDAASISRAFARDKIDVIVMKNGDRITCEISKLERGQLLIKTDYTIGTIPIDWTKVDRIESAQLFQIELTDGSRHSGAIELEPAAEGFRVAAESGLVEVDQPEVAVVEQLGRNFIQKLDGGLDFGLSATSNNNERQFTINGNLQRRTEKNRFTARLSSIVSRQSDGADTTRQNATFSFQRFVARSWLAGSVLDFLQSNEQQLDLRTTVGGFAGRHLLRSDKTDMVAFGGVVLNRERFFTETTQELFTNNVEGIFGTKLSVFRFDATQIDAQFLFYPSISESGRYRTDFSTDMYLELWGDLYLRMTFFHNFDSRPPIDAPGSDRGVTSSVGWSF